MPTYAASPSVWGARLGGAPRHALVARSSMVPGAVQRGYRVGFWWSPNGGNDFSGQHGHGLDGDCQGCRRVITDDELVHLRIDVAA